MIQFWLCVILAVLGWSGILLLMASDRWNIFFFNNLSLGKQWVLGGLISLAASIGIVGAIVTFP